MAAVNSGNTKPRLAKTGGCWLPALSSDPGLGHGLALGAFFQHNLIFAAMF